MLNIWCYDKCRDFILILSVIMLIVILLNVVFTPLIRVSVRSVFQTATVQFAVNTMHSLDCRA
jgi:hypothetical protein